MRRLLAPLLASCMVLCLIGVPTASAQDRTELPGEAGEAVEAVLAVIARAYAPDVTLEERRALPRAFDRAMASLAQAVKDLDIDVTKSEARGAGPRLALLALDHERDPKRLGVLIDRYWQGLVGSDNRRAQAPPVIDAHLAKEFRLAWEYALLRPAAPGSSPDHEQRAWSAITWYEDPASRVTARIAFEATTGRGTPASRDLARRQRLFLRIIGAVPSEAALRALADEIERAERQIAETGKPRRPVGFDPFAFCLELVVARYDSHRRPLWAAVLDRAPDTGTKTYRRLLEAARKAMGPQE
ncbi:MAG: hypothetical protein KDK53_06920 [Maritimibacter sp.]|nr:hypothetical protein [Maritimibacter sp.]